MSEAATATAPAVAPADENNTKTLSESIKLQVEFYFSAENLARDKWLAEQIDSNNSIDLSTVTNFPKMKALSQDAGVVKAALAGSTVVTITEDKIKVINYVKPLKRGILILRDVPADASEAEIREVFNFPGCKPLVSLNKDIEGVWSVYLDSEEDAKETYLMLKTDRQLRGEPVKVRVKQESVLKANSPVFVPGGVGGGAGGAAPFGNQGQQGGAPGFRGGFNPPSSFSQQSSFPPNANANAINSTANTSNANQNLYSNPFNTIGNAGGNNSNSNINNNSGNGSPSDSWKRSTHAPPVASDNSNSNSNSSSSSTSGGNNNSISNNINNSNAANSSQQKEKKISPNKIDNSNTASTANGGRNKGNNNNSKKEEPIVNPVKIDSVSFPPLEGAPATPGFKGAYTRWTHDEIIAIVKAVDVANAIIPAELQAASHPLAMSAQPNLDLIQRQRTYSIDEVREQLQMGAPVQRLALAEGSVDVSQLAGDENHWGNKSQKDGDASSSSAAGGNKSAGGSSWANNNATTGSWAKRVLSVTASTESSSSNGNPNSASASSSDESSRNKGAAGAKAGAANVTDKKAKGTAPSTASSTAGAVTSSSSSTATSTSKDSKDGKGDKKSGAEGRNTTSSTKDKRQSGGAEKESESSSPSSSSPNVGSSSSNGEESPTGPWKTSFASLLKK